MDPWKESIACYEKLADEVIILGKNFKKEFEFSDFGPMFDDGFNKASGDWVIKMDIDTQISPLQSRFQLPSYFGVFWIYRPLCRVW